MRNQSLQKIYVPELKAMNSSISQLHKPITQSMAFVINIGPLSPSQIKTYNPERYITYLIIC